MHFYRAPRLSITLSRWLLVLCSLYVGQSFAKASNYVEYDLYIQEGMWAPPGWKPTQALLVNGGIPGPTLRFRVGDTARIRVHNTLRGEDTSIHWHGLLLPNEQDGVPYVTTPPIRPGRSHLFEFPLTHAGTYWYHSHTGLQEQSGVFGSIVVLPENGEEHVFTDHDHVVVLHDWSRMPASRIMRELVRGSDWFTYKKKASQTLVGAWRAGAWADFWQRERDRMPPMDISDVYYDAFLANGQQRHFLPGAPGESVRLRIINAGASSYFYLQFAHGPMTIVAADGPAVHPIKVNRLLIGMAETYDVIVSIPETGAWEFRATAQDGTGHASVWFGQGEPNPAPEVPRPNLYRMDDHLFAALEEPGAGDLSDEVALANEPARPPAPYTRLRSLVVTAHAPELPRRTITLRATGDMERYIWSFNGKTFAEEGIIPVRRGEVIQLELINDTMMHHPLHLHGHFFRVLMGQGDHAPLKHTIDLPPMSRRIVEFETNDPGDWLFHCHLLYHMHAGMTRIFSYQDDDWTPPGRLKPDSNIVCNSVCCLPGNPDARSGAVDPRQLSRQPHAGEHDHDPMYIFAEGALLSHRSEGELLVRRSRDDFYAAWDSGYSDHPHHEIDGGYRRYITPNLSLAMGLRFLRDREERDTRPFASGLFRLPYLIDAGLDIDGDGAWQAGVSKSLPITSRLSLDVETEYDSETRWEGSIAARWLLNRHFSLVAEYHSEHHVGGGVAFRF